MRHSTAFQRFNHLFGDMTLDDWSRIDLNEFVRTAKNRIREQTSRLVQAGSLIRSPCAICANKAVEAHHTDYTDPFAVIWFCHKHHSEQHWPKD